MRLVRQFLEETSAIGLLAIVALYVTIGVMSAAGSVYIAKSIFSAKVEQIFFGLFLIPIAGFYLAFTAYFGDKRCVAVGSDGSGSVCCFRPNGSPSSICSHSRIPATWPMGHGPRVQRSCWRPCIGPSADPLAYGFFCATYDFLMATYFYTRRAAWSADSGSAAIA